MGSSQLHEEIHSFAELHGLLDWSIPQNLGPARAAGSNLCEYNRSID